MIRKQFHILPLLLALSIVFCSAFAHPAYAEELVDDLDLSECITDIVVTDDDVAMVTYRIPTDPYASMQGRNASGIYSLGTGEFISLSQDVTTNTYQSFEPILNLSFTAKYSAADNGYYYDATYTDFDAFRQITHMFLDGVLYELNFEENENRLSLLPMETPLPFYSVRLYKSDLNEFTPANTLRIWLRSGGEHTVIFGKMQDVTETVSEYDILMGSIFPLGIVGNAERVIDISDLKAGSTFDFTISYDYLLQSGGTVGDSSPFLKAFFYDENFEYLDETRNLTYELEGVSDDRIHGTHTATITVPEGAAYFSLQCVLPHINVHECYFLAFLVRDFEISCLTSALDANSKSLAVIQNKIDKVQQGIQDANDKLDDVNQGIQDTNDKLDDVNQGIQDTNDKLDDVLSGGEAGEDLSNAGDQLDQDNAELDNVIGNLDHVSGLLPDMPDNLQSVVGDNMAAIDNTNLAMLMPWNDEEYSEFWNAMFTPTLAAVSIALLLYFVFGKARSGK